MSGRTGPLQPLYERAAGPGGMSLATRIILINALAMALMVAGLLYFGRYLDRLVDSEVSLLFRQAQLIANRLGTETVTPADGAATLDTDQTRRIVAGLTTGTDILAQVFDPRLLQVADSRRLGSRMTPPRPASSTSAADSGGVARLARLFDWVAMQVPYGVDLPLYNDELLPQMDQLSDVTSALQGQPRWTLWTDAQKNLIVTVAVPVMQDDNIIGAVQVTRNSAEIATTLRSLRVELLQIFGLMLGVSMVLSLYMAQTIARPLRRLALSARRAQAITGGPPDVPDYSRRGDEIGELSLALRSMTRALWDRLDAIETFAADVSHEIKNPLTSMKSALETLGRVSDPAQQQKLIAILGDDINRMQRLITDISGASRLEAELSRAEPELFDLAALLTGLVTSRTKAGIPLEFHVSSTGLMVRGIPGRLVQVAENLIGNALTFSPAGQPIILRLSERNRQITLKIEDSGPGIPPGKEGKIFERFYSERPEGEEFGTHSGLGLSICKQIVEGHGGHITAENRVDETGRILGARFTVTLPQQLG